MYKEDVRSGKNGGDPLYLAIGAVVSIGACILFLAAVSFGMSVGWLKEELMERATVAACVLGSFAGGIVSSRHYAGDKILPGVLSGAILFLNLYLIGMLTYGMPVLDLENVLLLLACLCGGASSGVLRRKQPKKSRAGERSRKRRKR